MAGSLRGDFVRTPFVTTPIPSSEPSRGRWLTSALPMALVLFVFSLWLNTRHNDFAYSYHPDEFGKTG